MQPPFELKRRNIYLSSTPKGRRRFSKRAANVMFPIFSIVRRCGSIPWLKIVPPLTPPPLCLAPNPFLPNFRRPYSYCAGRSTHTGVKVSH